LKTYGYVPVFTTTVRSDFAISEVFAAAMVVVVVYDNK
jgi:hypothetical protein